MSAEREVAPRRTPEGNHVLREVVDSRGKSWLLFEVHPSGDHVSEAVRDNYHVDSWLCMLHGNSRRRIPVPVGWHLLSDVALLQLIEQAPPATRGRRRK